MDPQGHGLGEMMKEEEEFVIKMVKHIGYLNCLVEEIKKHLI